MLLCAVLAATSPGSFHATAWGGGTGSPPAGTQVIRFEDLEGLILLPARATGRDGADTSGVVVLDSGAGYLALDPGIIQSLGLSEAPVANMEFAPLPLERLEVGQLQMDQVSPILAVDTEVIRRASGRNVLGLAGQRLFQNRALAIDYAESTVAIVPMPQNERDGDSPSGQGGPSPRSRRGTIDRSRRELGDVIGPDAVAVPFQLWGDGKMVLRARLSAPRAPRFTPWLTFILDTGASKSVLFEPELSRAGVSATDWSMVRGLGAPTLLGVASASVARVPRVEVECPSNAVSTDGLDIAILTSDLGEVLTRVVGEPVHGLLGYSFLRRYHVVIDYSNEVMWLTPRRRWDDRPYEYSHVGLQLELADSSVRVMAVAEGSPAARAGIQPGDGVVTIDGIAVADRPLAELARLLEGKPGTSVRLSLRREKREQQYTLRRQKLL